MKRQIIPRFVLFKKIVAAIVVLNQAVFLLAPTSAALAQTSLGTAYNTTTDLPATANLTVAPLTIEFLTAPQSQFSGRKQIKVSSNYPDASVYFQITGAKSANFYAQHASGSTEYWFDWDTTVFPNGAYTIKAMASRSGFASITKSIGVFVQNQIAEPLTIEFVNLSAAALSGTVTLTAKTNYADAQVGFEISGPKYAALQAVRETTSGYYSASWKTIEFPNGSYIIKAKAGRNGLYAYSQAVSTVNNQTAPVSLNSTQTVPVSPTAGQASTTTAPTASSSTTSTLNVQPPATTLAIEHFSQFNAAVSGVVRLTAQTNILPDSVKFKIYGSKTAELAASRDADTNFFYADWDTAGFPSGNYYLTVLASKNSLTVNRSSSVEVRNAAANVSDTASTSQQSGDAILQNQPVADTAETTDTVSATTTAQSGSDEKTESSLDGLTFAEKPVDLAIPEKQAPTTDSSSTQTIGIEFLKPLDGQAVEESALLSVRSSGPIRRVEFYRLKEGGDLIILGGGRLNTTGHEWELAWPTKYLPAGNHYLKARAWDDKNIAYWSGRLSVAKKDPAQNLLLKEPTPVDQTASEKEAVQADASGVNESAKPYDGQALPPADELKTKSGALSEKPAGSPSIVAECQSAGFTSIKQCQTYLFERRAEKECRSADKKTKEDCLGYVLEKYKKPAVCERLGEQECRQLIEFVILADFIEEKVIKDVVDEIKPLFGKAIEFRQPVDVKPSAPSSEVVVKSRHEQTVLPAEAVKNLKEVMPFRPDRTSVNFMILPSAEQKDAEKAQAVIPALLLFDGDSDGLTDDIEKRLGTDPEAADSDGDGYSDGTEAANGHNPLGRGDSAREFKPVEKAIIKKAALEQPKTSMAEVISALKVEKVQSGKAVASSTAPSDPKLKFEGKALPNEVVTLYIYSSLPIVITVSADTDGNWVYELDKSLVDGKHEAYIVINDDDGKIKSKSAPFSFFIKEAQAVTEEDFLAEKTGSLDEVNIMIKWYASAGVSLIAFVLVLLFLYQRGRKFNLG